MEKRNFSSSNPWVTEEQSTSAVSNLLRVAERAGHLKKVGCFVSLLAQLSDCSHSIQLLKFYHPCKVAEFGSLKINPRSKRSVFFIFIIP